MTEDHNPTRLRDPDPWTEVSEAREQRGPIVAAWIVAAITFACSLQIWTRRTRPGPGYIPPWHARSEAVVHTASRRPIK